MRAQDWRARITNSQGLDDKRATSKGVSSAHHPEASNHVNTANTINGFRLPHFALHCLLVWLSHNHARNHPFLALRNDGSGHGSCSAFSRSHRFRMDKVDYIVQKVLHGVLNPEVHVNGIEKKKNHPLPSERFSITTTGPSDTGSILSADTISCFNSIVITAMPLRLFLTGS
jgi:hypothetical protein